MSQRNSSVLPILIGSSVLSAGIVASASACIRNIDSKSVSGPSLYLASGTGESFALLLDPQFASIYFHSAKFYFKRLASLTGWDLPAPTSLLARLFSGSWKAHYFLVLQGTHRLLYSSTV